jgi:pentatricopeptide repeat protein
MIVLKQLELYHKSNQFKKVVEMLDSIKVDDSLPINSLNDSLDHSRSSSFDLEREKIVLSTRSKNQLVIMLLRNMFESQNLQNLGYFEKYPDIEVQNTIIKGFYNSGQYEKSLEAISKLAELGLEGNGDTVHAEMLNLIKLDNLDKAFNIFKSLDLVNKYLCASILKGLILEKGKHNNLNEVQEMVKLAPENVEKIEFVLARIEKENIEKDDFIVQLLLKYYLLQNETAKALNLYNEFIKNAYPNNVILHTMFDGLFKNNIDSGIEFLQQTHQKGFTVTAPIYRTCLQALSSQNREETLYVYDIIRNRHLPLPIYNIVLRYCATNNNIDSFDSVWKDMRSRYEPNVISIEIALELYLKCRDVEKTKDIIDLAEKGGIKISSTHLVAFVILLCESREYKLIPQALKLLQEKKTDLMPTLIKHQQPLAELVCGLAADCRFADTIAIFNFLFDDTKLKPNGKTFEAVMSAYVAENNLLGLVKSFTKYQEANFTRTTGLIILTEGVLNLGQSKTSQHVLSMLKSWPIDDRKLYQNYIELQCKYGEIEGIPAMVVDYDLKFGIDTHIWTICQRRCSGPRLRYLTTFFEECFPEAMGDQ